MEFLHTADWQIGMKAAGIGAAGAVVREARLEAAGRVVALEADFLLVAGDTFEDNAVDRALVQRTAEILARFRGPVFLLPGNHDPLLPGSVWEHPVWGRFPNLHVIRDAGAYPVPGGTLLAAPLRETHSMQDPTLPLAVLERPAGIILGMSHGTVEGVDPGTEHHPIARQAAGRARVDYLALGHWHSTSLYKDGDGAVRMAYSGTHETTKFGERDSGNVLRVRIDPVPVVERVRTGGLEWQSIAGQVLAPGDLAGVQERLAALPERALVKLELQGILHLTEGAVLGELDALRERFTFLTVDASGLRPAAADGWEEQLPAGAVRLAARRLRERAAAGEREAVEALLELQALAAQVGV